MANSIRVKLDTSKYVAPTQADINAAKKFILQREEYARLLENRVDEILNDAAERIVIICYRYNVDPQYLYFGSGFNEQMMAEISDVMDEIEQASLTLSMNTRQSQPKTKTGRKRFCYGLQASDVVVRTCREHSTATYLSL